MPRGTKIVATLGPACYDTDVLERLLQAGTNVVRLNFSHGSYADHQHYADVVRLFREKHKLAVAILADLQGPKIRIGVFERGKIELREGETFILDAQCRLGNQTRVGLDYKDLLQSVTPGAILLLDDGKLELEVQKIQAEQIYTTVRVGGPLSDHKGINLQGGGLTAPALTEKDKEDIQFIAKLKPDYVAVSFPKNGADMREARLLLSEAGSDASLIAKIERKEAISNIDDILEASDGVMIARGDLAVEVGAASVPVLQKKIVKQARRNNKLVIVATQMMESMLYNPVPTRAEVSDVANAVLDGTDAVMLSAESASGKYPVQTVIAMAKTCLEAEKLGESQIDDEFEHAGPFQRRDQTVAMAALYACHHFSIKGIETFSLAGTSALWLSRYSNGIPIYAFTRCQKTYQRLALFRHVYPMYMLPEIGNQHEKKITYVQQVLLCEQKISEGERIVLTFKDCNAQEQGIDTLCIIESQAEHEPSLF